MLEIFEKLTMALYGNVEMSLIAAFIWGILSIVLSPCHLASIPLVVAFINEQKEISTKKAFYISLMFSLGILITLAIAGVISVFIGMILGTTDLVIRIIVGIMLLLVGLYFLGLLPLPDLGSSRDRRVARRPYLSGFIMGLIFGIALGPCALAFMAPIIGIVMQSISTQFWFCAGLVVAYITGHCGIIILAGTFTEAVKKYLSWDITSKGTKIIRIVCGILIIAGALITFIKLIVEVN
jgi:cytochrome c-type biogenesis protein